jgi:hypothetical protein
MKAQLFQANFKGGPVNGMTFSVEVGQMVLYSVEVKDGEEIKHRYEVEGGEFVYKGVCL